MSYPVGPLRVFTAHSLEVSDYRGAYFGEAGIDYEWRLSKKAKLEITPNIGWASAKFNEANIGVPKAAFNLVAVESSLTYYVNKNLYLRPEFGFSRIMDAQLRVAALHPTFLISGWPLELASQMRTAPRNGSASPITREGHVVFEFTDTD